MTKVTIEEVLAEVDELKPNQYDDRKKIEWISALDSQIYQDIILTHQKNEEDLHEEYSEEDIQTELLVPKPYASIYTYYVSAMIDFFNGETDRYQNSMIMYNNAYETYANWYNRMHMPIGGQMKF